MKLVTRHVASAFSSVCGLCFFLFAVSFVVARIKSFERETLGGVLNTGILSSGVVWVWGGCKWRRKHGQERERERHRQGS